MPCLPITLPASFALCPRSLYHTLVAYPFVNRSCLDGGCTIRTLAGGRVSTVGLLTIALFLYILLIPVIKGIPADYRSWRESGELSSVIPVLTTSIISGWAVLCGLLGLYSSLGYILGTIGGSGIYALVFGIMGLLPAPRVARK
ncbi:hypothetical protein EI94DRAFT_943509 [Lactarius quietus]|nr:hypothetical protein EI94DRAFT_943509 [Lactarius quietus]